MSKKVTHHFRNDGKSLIHCGAKWIPGKTAALIDGFWEFMLSTDRFKDNKPCKKCLRLYNAN